MQTRRYRKYWKPNLGLPNRNQNVEMDVRLLSPVANTNYQWIDPKWSLDLSLRQNEKIQECSSWVNFVVVLLQPKRLYGMRHF
jgi:hypothetical protein